MLARDDLWYGVQQCFDAARGSLHTFFSVKKVCREASWKLARKRAKRKTKLVLNRVD